MLLLLHVATRLLSAFALLGAVSAADTVLDEHFCQKYYNLKDGNCTALRETVRSEVRGDGTPTLELGDPSTQPAMFFIHGWPDTSATWANQFDAFCGSDKEYFCVAPSMIDFHPDYPLADESDLLWRKQREKFLAVIEDLGLSDITLVIFDFGAVIGYTFVYEYPHLISRLVAMDIPNSPGPGAGPGENYTYENFLTEPYQYCNIQVFLAKDDPGMVTCLQTTFDPRAPCKDCKIAPNATVGIGARTGWPYYIINKTVDPWTEALTDKPTTDWNFMFTPDMPSDIPLLYLWSFFFEDPTYNSWVNGRGDGVSKTVYVNNSDHWVPNRFPEFVNAEMAEWFDATAPTPSPTSEDTSSACRVAGASAIIAGLFSKLLLH